MRAWHNFLPMTPEELIKAKYKAIPGKTYHWCKKCNTVVAYNNDLSVREVNQRMDTTGRVPCMPKGIN
jgi:hypothetical protein